MTDFKHDPQEDNPETKKLIDQAREEAEKKLDEAGFVQRGPAPMKLWAEQKKILKEKYNIDWKTPFEMNPDIRF